MFKNKKVLTVMVIILAGIIFCGCNEKTADENYKLIRIHIRADSNAQNAQAVKLKVRDAVSAYLENKLGGVSDFETAYKLIGDNLTAVKREADKVLKNEGFSYTSTVRLNNEFFPARSYEGIIVDSGYYDALIIELGSGQGDNWWCVIYPPLCYLEAQGEGNFQYKSKIKEIWDKYFG